jgi:hypothetical protein
MMMFSRIEADDLPSSEIHRHNLKSLGQDWTGVKTNQTCLSCLRRKPEHVLHCGHAMCDTCVCIFGKAMQGVEYHFELFGCIVCQSDSQLTVRLKPPTAGTRLLTVDGGGIRGAVSLEFLDALERTLSLPYPLQDEFDFALGTSSGTFACSEDGGNELTTPGGLIVLLLFLGRRSVKHCISTFDKLAKRIFVPRNHSRRSFCTRIHELFTSWLADSRYDPTVLEASLEEVYGTNCRMFDVAESGPSGTKVAVTATTISDATLCIFSNYNGAATRRKNCGTCVLE